MNWIYVIVGAAVGAPLRYVTDRAVQRRHSTPLPLGTLLVNLIASFLLGVVTGAHAVGAVSTGVLLLLGTGLAATLSTYATFSFETLRLAQHDGKRLAAANLALSLVLGLALAVAGVAIGKRF